MIDDDSHSERQNGPSDALISIAQKCVAFNLNCGAEKKCCVTTTSRTTLLPFLSIEMHRLVKRVDSEMTEMKTTGLLLQIEFY